MSHEGTDFDGLASMVLAQKLYPGSHLVFPGPKQASVREFYNLHRRHFPDLEVRRALEKRPTRIIMVDTRTPSRLGRFREWAHDPQVELHIYDHHPPNAESVTGDQEWVEPVGAAVTLLIERCRAEGLKLSTEEASLALLAIHEETGSFRYSSTTPRDLEAAAFLLGEGANLDVVSAFLKDPLTPPQRELFKEFLQNARRIEGGAGVVFISRVRRTHEIHGLNLLASRFLDLESFAAVVLVQEVEGHGCSITARSASDAINVAEWLTFWGGGGHPRAASAARVGATSDSICERLAELADSADEAGVVARDVMSTELFTIALEVSVDDAYSELKQRGFHSACIIDESKELQGVVSRTDLTRALEHGLGHAPARSVMTHKVVSVTTEDSLDDVRRLAVEKQVSSLPVLEEGRLVGIITVTDLLREMYQGMSESETWSHSGPGQRVSLAEVSQPNLDRIRVAAKVAAEERVRVYVVGGFVRDFLLGRPNDDLDLVVEGDAIALARVLHERLGGRLVLHEKYLTASIHFSGDDKLDLATARREVYVRPAALPEVAQSKLKSDLYRRDFTVNALALRLSDNLTGVVIDFFGGQKDLDSRKISVLHNHSFFDDPTRILRAVRFEQRLGFRIEPHTTHLIGAALDADIFSLANPERLAEEFRLSLSEYDPVKVLQRLDQLKVLRGIHRELNFRHKAKERTISALDFMDRHPEFVPPTERWRVPLQVLGLGLTERGRQETAERFNWNIEPWPVQLDVLLQDLSRHSLTNGEMGEILDPLSTTQIAVLSGFGMNPRIEERLETYAREIRGVDLLINGHDILERGTSPGPEVALWKAKALAAQRDGLFNDREGALAWLEGRLAGQA